MIILEFVTGRLSHGQQWNKPRLSYKNLSTYPFVLFSILTYIHMTGPHQSDPILNLGMLGRALHDSILEPRPISRIRITGIPLIMRLSVELQTTDPFDLGIVKRLLGHQIGCPGRVTGRGTDFGLEPDLGLDV